ncbi:sigma-70 family RNA polymerase sigma factor [Hominicoprocola fusiformis]|nr:sigma-70 family RNA polymerase sigma factor [Hominicoprocola fusiformis]
MNDERTITAIKNRNEAAINEVITKYSKLLWAVAGAVLNNMGSTQDVEECVADTFIYLWEHPDKYDPQRGKLKTWLSIVARTQAVNRCREISKRNTISLENTDFIDQLGVVDNILEAETRKSLIAAVNALGEPNREILIRRYYYDQKPKEIALAMDMSVKQVDNRLYQTKLKLRESLSN